MSAESSTSKSPPIAPLVERLSAPPISTAPRLSTGIKASPSWSAAASDEVTSYSDDLVGAREDQGWNSEAERTGRLEIDDQLECRRLLDRQIGR